MGVAVASVWASLSEGPTPPQDPRMTTRLIRCVTLTVTFCLALPAQAQTAAARPMNPLASYPERYALINRELPTYRTVTADMDNLGIERRSTDGGKVEASCKGTETRLIIASDFGEHSYTETHFYYWNNLLFYVQVVSKRSDQLYGPTVETTEDRLYYLNGKLVRLLNGQNVPRPLNTTDARKLDSFIRTDAGSFFTRLAGCPLQAPSATVSAADTAAPTMVPLHAAVDTGMRVAAMDTGMKVEGVLERAYVAAMKSDLRNLATYEEQFAADNNGDYFGGEASRSGPLHGFTPSNYVTIEAKRTGGSPPSWSATATHSKSSKTCVQKDGVINCEYAVYHSGGSRNPNRNAGALGTAVSAASVIPLARDQDLAIPAGSVQSFRWTPPSNQPNCHVSGHVEVTDGGNRDVRVLVMRGDDYQNYINRHEARVYFQTENITAVTLDVNTSQAGPLVLAISNAFSVVSAKKVRLSGLQATCR
jgi:hypothetical protein